MNQRQNWDSCHWKGKIKKLNIKGDTTRSVKCESKENDTVVNIWEGNITTMNFKRSVKCELNAIPM